MWGNTDNEQFLFLGPYSEYNVEKDSAMSLFAAQCFEGVNQRL